MQSIDLHSGSVANKSALFTKNRSNLAYEIPTPADNYTTLTKTEFVQLQFSKVILPKINKQCEYWQQELKNIKNCITLPFYHETDNYKIATSQPQAQVATKSFATLAHNRADLIAALLLYLYRINNYAEFTVAFNSGFVTRLPKEYQQRFTEYVPLTFAPHATATIDESIILTATKIAELEQHQTFAKELLSEHPDLHFLNISINTVRSLAQYNPLQTTDIAFILSSDLQLRIDCAQHVIESNQHLRNALQKSLAHIENILTAINVNTKQAINNIQLLTAAEYETIVNSWNATAAPYPLQQTLGQLIEQQVAKKPSDIAIVCNNTALTYGELNQQVNQLAHFLRDLGVKPNTLVGLCISKSTTMIIGMLGILKAGGAYLPLDPNYPENRLRLIIDDAQIKIILSEQKLLAQLPLLAIHAEKVICLDFDSRIHNYPQHNPETTVTSQNLAYSIYTSGTTGKPKGALIKHEGVINLAHFINCEIFKAAKPKHVAQFSSICFDASVLEVWTALACGSTLHIITDDVRKDYCKLHQFIISNSIDAILLPPAVLKNFPHEPIPTLTTLFIGGDVCDHVTATFWRQHTRLVNLYGPTEITVFATLFTCLPEAHHIYIGKPCANTQIYILDKYLQPVPIGAIGEMYIGGNGVCLGYLNRPEYNQERFIPDRFCTTGKLYKTGDLARWLPDGNIDYVGRIDNQVKIRGFRVELEEINNWLEKYPGIKQAFTLIKKLDQSNAAIIAYLVCRNKETFNVNFCRAYLKKSLPDYMMPSGFVILDELPLNTSGKIDSSVLAALAEEHLLRATPYVVATTPTEIALRKIWSEILGIQEEHISTQDNFFEVGGNSLSTVQGVLKINNLFNINLTLQDFFNAPTIIDLAKQVSLASQHQNDVYKISAASQQDDYPLSYPQELLWVHQQIAPNTPLYNESIIIQINEKLDPGTLENSLNFLVKRHEILRTNIVLKNNQPRQKIHAQRKISLQYHNLNKLSPEQQIKLIATIGKRYIRKPFDLQRDQLLRAILFQLKEGKYQLFIVAHHIIVDGIAIAKIQAELQAIYYSLSTQQSVTLPAPVVQYKDYSVWQKNQTKENTGAINYWREQVRELQPLQLSSKSSVNSYTIFAGHRQSLTLPIALIRRLEHISKQEGTTLFMSLLAVFNVLLFRYTGQNDIAVCTAAAGRNHIQLENVVGNFINMIILRNRLSDNESFQQLLQHIKQNTFNAYNHQDLPFQEVLRLLPSQREKNQHLPCNIAFIFESNSSALSSNWSFTQNDIHSNTAKFDLMFTLDHRPNGMIGSIEYNTNLFDSSFILQLIANFKAMLQNIVSNLQAPINSIPMLSLESQHLMAKWNNNAKSFHQLSINELFSQRAIATPNKTAVTFEQRKFSYRELNNRANQLANYLIKCGTKPDTLVALCIERSMETVLGILGILKANAAYVPLDPSYPQARIKDILTDCEAPILVTTKNTFKQLQLNTLCHQNTRIVFLDTEWHKISRESVNNPVVQITNESLAYVIYTSGSTGKPKGILLPHRTITNLIHWQAPRRSKKQLNIAQFAAFGFDVSLQETFYALLNGYTLHIINSETKKSINKLLDFLAKREINKLFLPPTVLGLLAHEANSLSISLPHLNEIIVAGEALIITNDMREFYTRHPHMRLANHYGPSETHVVTAFTLAKDPAKWTNLPAIGKPIANTEAYVLNTSLQPVPINVPGELYLGGTGMARCYLNRPELNQQKFITNPFCKDPNARLYKTGDLVRWLPDGNLAFIERIDNQVKIRGFRIELEEIEHCLLQHSAVHQCVIVAQADQYNTKKLVAYLVARDKTRLDIEVIKQHLRDQLPEYMLPAIFVPLEKLPLNTNGKVNKEQLPKPNLEQHESTKALILPRNETETILAELWAKILGISSKTIGINDDFFTLGGHSLAALHLLSELRKAFNIELEPHELFSATTIMALNNLIVSKQAKSKGKLSKQCQSHLILLKPGQAQLTPLFLIHPIGGTIFWYQTLTKHMRCKHAVYGIQDPAISTPDKVFNNLKEMASFYLTLIKQVQPHGPYLLGGASFGGTVAIEIAHQLKQQGEATKHVLLFDSWATYPDQVKQKDIFENGIRHMHKSLVAKSASKGLAEDIKSWLDLQWHRAKLLWDHLLPAITHNMTLFKARDPLEFFTLKDDPNNYWHLYSSGSIDTHLVPGDHETMFLSPNVEILAKKLEECLEALSPLDAEASEE